MSKWHGNNIYKGPSGNWRYWSDKKLVSSDPNRKCGRCGIKPTSEGHDGCLGTLPGLMNACCGHGETSKAYIQFLDKSVVRGKSATIIITELKKVNQYTDKVGKQIVTLVGKALNSMKPVKLYAGNGVTRFQVNRRNNNGETLLEQTGLEGPNDYSVPVLKVVNRKGKIIAVAFGYACHPTVLKGYKWSGDYPGFAQIELEKSLRGTTALFFQGAGADQNPLPRRTEALAKQYGKELAIAVERALVDEIQELAPELLTAYSEIELALINLPTQSELLKMAGESSGYKERWAIRLNSKLKEGGQLKKSYPYPLQVWSLGGQPIISMGGELVTEYALGLKRIFGHHIFVLGYSNDVMGYIPSTTILMEGGYEGASSQIVYGLSGVWAPNIEIQILHEILKLAEKTKIPFLSETNLIND